MDKFTRILETSGGIMLFVGTIIIFIASCSRYLLSHSIIWSEESCRILILACAFWLCGAMETKNKQVALTIVSENIKSPAVHRVLDYIKYIVALVMSVIITIYGWQQFQFVKGQTTFSGAFPKQLPAAIVPIGMSICAVYLILKLFLMVTEERADKEVKQ